MGKRINIWTHSDTPNILCGARGIRNDDDNGANDDDASSVHLLGRFGRLQ
jgi:hypothetical protein